MERKEERINKKKIELIVKKEKEKWNLLKKHQEEKKKRKIDKTKYDKYIVQEPNQIRILVIGESCSGKTSLIRRFINDTFSPEYKTTLTIEAFKSELLFLNDQSFRVELIDTPPLENFYKYLDDVLYFVHGVIFVFDASNKNSFLRMQDYFKITNFYEFQKIGIVATKKDICTEKDKYKYYQLERFCETHNAIPYFLSFKNNKDEISKFINLLCPEIIPSLVNKKEKIDLQYPYTKSVKNNFPKKNIIDEAILKKAKEEDSSYESEESKNNEKDKEQEIKEFYLKKKNEIKIIKEKEKNKYIYNIGNNNNKYKGDLNLEEKKEELQSFNNVIGNVNIDLEKLFKKYRPESGSIINDGRHKNRRKYNKDKNKTLEDGGEWVNVNIDALVDEFMKTKTELKKNMNKTKKSKNNEDKKIDSIKSSNKISNKSESQKSKKSKKSKNEERNEKEEKNDNNKDNKNDEDEKRSEKKSEEIKEDEKESEEDKKESEEYNEEYEERNSKEEQEMNDEYYENLYGDIYDFQQSLKNEVLRDQNDE